MAEVGTPPLGASCAGCTRSQIGEPTWTPARAVFFSGAVGASGEGFLPLLQTILGPKHRFYPEVGTFGPAVAHAGPYDEEVYGLLAAQNIVPKQTFTAAEFTPPLAVGMLLAVVPSSAAPAGSSFDFPSGPIIPKQHFPITVAGSLHRNGSFFEGPFNGELPGYDQFLPPIDVDGSSHLFVPFGANSSVGPSGTPAPGSYDYTLVLLDPTGAGWAIRLPFIVDGGGGGTDGGTDAGRDGGGVQVCTGSPPPSALITNFSDAVAGPPITFGSTGGIMGGPFAYAAPGLTPPAFSLVAAADGGTGKALRVVANPGTPTDPSNGYFGFGLYFLSCIDASAYNGIKFTIAGDSGACSINFAPTFSEDLSHDSDPKGSCTATSCFPPSLQLTGTGTKSVRFADLQGGNPGINDPAAIAGLQWQMNTPGGQPCTADFTVTDISFVTDAAPPICPFVIRPPSPLIIGPGSVMGGSPRTFTFSAPGLQPPTVYLLSSTSGQLEALEVTADPGATSDPRTPPSGSAWTWAAGSLAWTRAHTAGSGSRPPEISAPASSRSPRRPGRTSLSLRAAPARRPSATRRSPARSGRAPPPSASPR